MTTNTSPVPATPIPASGLVLTPGRWELDPYHSRVGFSIRHLGIAKVRGRFGEFTTTLDVGSGLDDSTLDATVQIATIDTGNADRDAHVLSADMLDVELRPALVFTSSAIRVVAADRWEVDGEVTIGHVSRPLVLAVEFGGISEPTPFDGRRHAGFEAVGEVRRSELGLTFGAIGDTMLGDVVTFHLDVQLVEPAVDTA